MRIWPLPVVSWDSPAQKWILEASKPHDLSKSIWFWPPPNRTPEKAMAPHSSTLAWQIPWTEEPGGLQTMGLLGVRHNWATSLSLFTFMHWRRKWQPLQCSCLENPRDRRAWWAAVYGVAQSRTRLKWLSSSSSSKQNTTGKLMHHYGGQSSETSGSRGRVKMLF